MPKLILIILLLSNFSHASVLDSFRDPSTVILNQKDCYLGSTKGEIADGNYIVNNLVIVARLKKLDEARVSYESSITERPLLLRVEISNKQISAYMPNNQPLIICNLR